MEGADEGGQEWTGHQAPGLSHVQLGTRRTLDVCRPPQALVSHAPWPTHHSGFFTNGAIPLLPRTWCTVPKPGSRAHGAPYLCSHARGAPYLCSHARGAPCLCSLTHTKSRLRSYTRPRRFHAHPVLGLDIHLTPSFSRTVIVRHGRVIHRPGTQRHGDRATHFCGARRGDVAGARESRRIRGGETP